MPRRPLSILAALVTLASCNGDSEVGGMEVDLYDREVGCDEGASCVDEWGADAMPESLGGFAFITTETSEHHPDGLFVYFEVVRPDGAIGRGEIDVALRGDGEPTVRYDERLGSEIGFVAEEVVGVVEVPEEALGEECDCLDGRFELVLRSADGQVRRLSRGRFGWESRPCLGRARFTELEDELRVVPRTCGDDPVPVGPRYDPPPDYDHEPPRYYDGGGCDTSACNGTTTSSSASCGSGGGSGCDSGAGGGCDGGGGCEGDVGGAGGCAGDAGGAGGCAGDTGGCRVTGPRRVGPRGPLQTALLVGAALAWVLRPRRRR